MQRWILIAIVFLTVGLPPRCIAAAPTIDTVGGALSQGSNIDIGGSGFGPKQFAAPAYFNTLENETTGRMPADQITNQSAYGTVETNRAKSGLKSLEFDYCADAPGTLNPHCTNGKIKADWKRNTIDLGPQGADRIYVTAWLLPDKGTTSTTGSWQWKGFPTITSSEALYYDLPIGYPGLCEQSVAWQNTAVFTGYWYYNNDHWSNTGSGVYYYDSTACKTMHGGSTGGLPADTLLWNQWQRLEFYAQRSSAPGAADGIWRGRRIGRASDTFVYTDAMTHLADNRSWRYVVLSHALESVIQDYVELKIYVDDIYVDTTRARVELCDTTAWSERGHCEIQIPTAWDGNNNTISATVNTGSFASGDPVYLFVVNETGEASDGYGPLAVSTDTPAAAPAEPSGLIVH